MTALIAGLPWLGFLIAPIVVLDWLAARVTPRHPDGAIVGRAVEHPAAPARPSAPVDAAAREVAAPTGHHPRKRRVTRRRSSIADPSPTRLWAGVRVRPAPTLPAGPAPAGPAGRPTP